MSELFILIVDDKPQNLFALETILSSVPATIIKANSGDEALAKTLNYDFALAILDVQMPQMDGYELAGYLLDDPSTSRIPIIFLSAAYADEQHTFKGYENGAVDYIVKPFEPAILLSKVNVFLELARYRIELEKLVHERTTALKDEESKLRSIIDNTPDIIFNINNEGAISFINAPYNNLVGSSVYKLLDCPEIDLPKNIIKKVFVNKEKSEFESPLKLPWLSNATPFSLRLSPIIADNKVLSCLMIARDISDSKLVESTRIDKMRAEAENSAKSKFLASMSHEIRTPMNAILGYTQLLKRDRNLTDKQNRYLEVIENSGEHLLALIDSILDMARIESGRMILSPAKFNLTKLITDIVRMFELAANKKGIEILYSQFINEYEWIYTDPNKIRQVLINLVGNALKFTTEGKIEIQSGVSDSTFGQLKFFIEVKDTGCGISSEKIQTIFEPFVQADETCSQSGVGLGLSVSREIARLMAGSLTVNSELGKGSLFRFEFTAQITEQPNQTSINLKKWMVTEGANTQILVVDDDQDNLNLVGSMLVSAGLTVSLASSGEEAIRLFTNSHPGLVILDYQMTPISGVDVTKKIRGIELSKDTPIIMITASPLLENREQSIMAGASAFLGKPFREQDLFKVIQEITPIKFSFEQENISLNTRRTTNPVAIKVENLPNSMIVELQEAIRSGYPDEIYLTIERIENENSIIGHLFRDLANSYRYLELLALIDKNGGGHAR